MRRSTPGTAAGSRAPRRRKPRPDRPAKEMIKEMIKSASWSNLQAFEQNGARYRSGRKYHPATSNDRACLMPLRSLLVADRCLGVGRTNDLLTDQPARVARCAPSSFPGGGHPTSTAPGCVLHVCFAHVLCACVLYMCFVYVFCPAVFWTSVLYTRCTELESHGSAGPKPCSSCLRATGPTCAPFLRTRETPPLPCGILRLAAKTPPLPCGILRLRG